MDCLSQRRPFGTDPSLRNIVTGVVTKEVVNCDKAKEARNKIVTLLVGKNVFMGIYFKRSAFRKVLQFSDDKVQLDPPTIVLKVQHTSR